MSVNVRRATAADIASMLDLQAQSPTAAHWTEQQYRQLFQNTGEGMERFFIVAESFRPAAEFSQTSSGTASVPQGFLVARHIAPEWELENIAVTPSARRKGIGKCLLDALLKQAQETNSDAVFLEVRASNVAARHFYEKAGFQAIGLRTSYYTNPTEDAVLYRHRLA